MSVSPLGAVLKKWLSALALFLFASSAPAATYYLAPASAGGSDSNSGLSANVPWLTPNHSVNCGDVILAAPSNAYAATNFRVNEWGTVSCASGNNVAWLKCQVFDACKITINSIGHNAMTPSQSYWGVQGWEVTATTFSGNQCFEAFPPNSSTTVHHIIFANNIANGCGDGAFTTGASGNAGVDYLAIVGNIAYNGAQDNANCYSGIDVFFPANFDAAPGTHIYIGGNFAWGNIDPNPCGAMAPTDGHGIFFDTVNALKYKGQILIENNISVFNGASGIHIFDNAGNSPNAAIYIRNNTTYGNQTGAINASPCAEVTLSSSLSTTVSMNLVQASGSSACNVSGSPQPLFALGVSSPDSTDVLKSNFIYSQTGNNTAGSGSGFSYGSNTVGTNPDLANPVNPPAPNCGNSASVPACMATVVADFTPKAAAAAPYGYQTPSSTQTFDPLFPQWLCTVSVPSGLVTMGCGQQSSLPPKPSLSVIKVQ
jgi:hypothetical protein